MPTTEWSTEYDSNKEGSGDRNIGDVCVFAVIHSEGQERDPDHLEEYDADWRRTVGLDIRGACQTMEVVVLVEAKACHWDNNKLLVY